MAKAKTPKSKTPPDDELESETPDGDDGDDDIDAKINAAITNRFKSFEKRIEKTLADTVAKLASAKPSEEDDGDDDATEGDPDAGPAKKPIDSAAARKLAKIEKDLKREREARERAEAEAKTTEDKRKAAEEDQSLESALRDKGVTNPVQLKAAKAMLKAEGRVIRDEAGQIRLAGKDKHGYDVQFDMDSGVEAWVKSDEGKTFLPARQVGGTGTGGASANGGRGSGSGKRYKDLPKLDQDKIELERAIGGLPSLQPDDLV